MQCSNLNIDGLTTHGDNAYTILATDRVVATGLTALAEGRPCPRSSECRGQGLTITDEFNGITSTNTLVVSRAGSDTIVVQGTNVGTITISSTGALITVISDGSSKWIVQSSGRRRRSRCSPREPRRPTPRRSARSI